MTMNDLEKKLDWELRLAREHLNEAIKLSEHYGIQDRLREAATKVEDAFVWFKQTHK